MNQNDISTQKNKNYFKEVNKNPQKNQKIKNTIKYYWKNLYFIKNMKNIIIYLIFIIIKNILSSAKIIKGKQNFISFYDSYITYKIKETGKNIAIYNCEGCSTSYPFPNPNEIYINGFSQSNKGKNFDLNETENEIKLVWKNNIDSTGCMFIGCSKITEIDLSNFDSSQVIYMVDMFNGCSSLTSLNLFKFNTSKVTSMAAMFQDCSSLTSLDLSNFKTLELEDTRYMFNGCKSLITLDLSSFDTTKVKDMYHMFKGCSSLEYLDLGNSVINARYYDDILDGIYENITQCGESNGWFTLLMGASVYYTIHITCHPHDKNTFLKKCYKKYGNLPNYKYLCKSCGKNYYYNYSIIASHYSLNISCYETPDGYFLDLNELNPTPKPCYLTCKLCNKEGNESNHNCLECKENYSIIESIYGDYKNCYNETPTSTSITACLI